ncbi:hypothetical protein FHY55_04740 [Oceanicola sp. D3]|uniref:hypothetical protein n=1 Tax=Oceanicola sp. D3 TaxID=2587163 RepID=UPI001123265A|nr:hypothetical protein [Oceanicola sp. D3]QDC08588.1 hypothetical protein FHY55_04740 [Oceanicola sp. D3]
MATSWKQEGGEHWGPWILHDGKGCPVRAGTVVEVVCEDRFGFAMRQVTQVVGGSYSSWDWTYFPELKKIIRFREKKPKGMTMLEEQMAPKETSAPKTPAKVD